MFNGCVNTLDLCKIREVSSYAATCVKRHFLFLQGKLERDCQASPLCYQKHLVGGNCKRCQEYTKFRCPSSEITKYLCRRCLHTYTMSMGACTQKWKVPNDVLLKSPCVTIGEDVYCYKVMAKNIALIHHGGPDGLALACEGKAKNARLKKLTKLSYHLPERQRFERSEPVKLYITSGTGGLKGLKRLAIAWQVFLDSRDALPNSLRNFVRLSWFSEDPHVDVRVRAERCVVELKRAEELNIYDVGLSSSEEKIEYIKTGNKDILERLEHRRDIMIQVPYPLRRYVFDFYKELLYSKFEKVTPEFIEELQEKHFLVTETSYKYHFNKLSQQGNDNPFELAKKRALMSFKKMGGYVPSFVKP